VQIQTVPLILTFGVTDPVGALGIQADQAVFGAFGCHALTVSTGLLIADTARVDDLHEMDPDWVADQARVLLEDMPVAAFKVGSIASIEQATVIAEIVSDYPDVPLILDPFLSSLPDSGLADDEMLNAIRSILVPQATVLLLSQVELARMAETWRDGSGDGCTTRTASSPAVPGATCLAVSSAPAARCRPRSARSWPLAPTLPMHSRAHTTTLPPPWPMPSASAWASWSPINMPRPASQRQRLPLPFFKRS
jgi:hypothetical protein